MVLWLGAELSLRADVTFGTIEFEPPTPQVSVTFGEIEFDAPASEGTVTFGTLEFEPPPSEGSVEFGEIEFEVPPSEIAKSLGERVREVMKKHRQTMKSINRSLDQLEKDKLKASGKWHVNRIQGGTTVTGLVKSLDQTASYEAPKKVPQPATVAVGIQHPALPDEEGALPSLVTVIDALAVLQGDWTYEETVKVRNEMSETGPEGVTSKRGEGNVRIYGQGQTVLVEPRPTNQDETETTASMHSYGRRALYVQRSDSFGVYRGSTFEVFSSPSKFRQGIGSEHGTGSDVGVGDPSLRDVALGYVNLVKSGDQWEIADWEVDLKTPKIEYEQFLTSSILKKEQDTRGNWLWKSYTFADRNRYHRDMMMARPTKSYGAMPKKKVFLKPAGEREYVATLRFEDNTVSSKEVDVRRVVIWNLRLTISAP